VDHEPDCRAPGTFALVTRTDDAPVPDYPGLLRLDGRRFVVLGAGQGIGRQAAHALASVGARLACVDQDADLAADIAAEVDATPLIGNAFDRADMERMFDDAGRALGGIDGVVDIIGMSRYADLVDMSDDDWNWHFDIVLRHAFLAMQYGGRAMREHGGTMVFVASVSGITSAPRHSAYGAAKAGLMSLVRTGAVELGPSGIRVNAVAPGVVWTPRVSAFLGDEGERRNIVNTPLRRVAQPADIAAALLFLSSDLSGYVTGQTLSVDGGVGAKFPYPMADL
jgi:NAD(P)-dependent dehydrogenase (short-subunit alcohol dehydrogenase family)